MLEVLFVFGFCWFLFVLLYFLWLNGFVWSAGFCLCFSFLVLLFFCFEVVSQCLLFVIVVYCCGRRRRCYTYHVTWGSEHTTA